MQLRSLIRQGIRPPGDPATPATVATLATLATETAPRPSTVATVATVAALESVEPEEWAALLRASRPAAVTVDRWSLAIDALESLLAAGIVAEAMAMGWDARELVGVTRRPPHDAPAAAGLIFSMRQGDNVRSVTSRGCVIVAANVHHLWHRTPLDGSVCLPWEIGRGRC